MTDFAVSVIIPTYNRRAQVVRCLRHLELQTFDQSRFEVVVVDDGSTDGTVEALLGLATPLNLKIVKAAHEGPSHARNLGIESSIGEILALTEDDVIPRSTWIASALETLDQGADVVDGRTVYEGSDSSVRRYESDDNRRAAFIPCNLFMRRSVFDQVGGYDPSFFDRDRKLYFREDSDFGFRVLDAGYTVRLCVNAVVEHPRQFASFREAVNHSKRYELDGLLAKKHPIRFRSELETRSFAGVEVPRPLHYVCLAHGLACGLAVAALASRRTRLSLSFLLAGVGLATTYSLRYRSVGEIIKDGPAAFVKYLVLPIVYLSAIGRGAVRFKSLRVFL